MPDNTAEQPRITHTPRPAGAGRRLLVVYQHAPTPGAPGIYRHRTLLAELVRRGWHVDLVSSPINYMTGTAAERYQRARNWRVHETIDGIHHHWVRASGNVHRSLRHRLANYASFAAAATLCGSLLPRADVVWASSPPLSIGGVGATLARRHRCPWIFEIRDLWPESAAAVGWLSESSLPYRLARRLAHRYARGAQAVIVPTPGLVAAARSHGARDATVITGTISDNEPQPDIRAARRTQLGIGDDTCLVVYVGAHGDANGLDTLLNAAHLLRDGATPDKVRIVTAGSGGAFEHLAQRVDAEQLNSVTMLGAIPKDEVIPLLAASDVCLHMLRDDQLFRGALPTKALEYLGAHRSFITTVDGLPRELAEASGGAFAPTTDALADEIALWAAMSQMQRRERHTRAFAYGSERFGLVPTVDRLESVLDSVVAQSRQYR